MPDRKHLLLLALAMALAAPAARAADHRDGAVLKLAPGDGDLTGLYAWISYDGKRLDLVLPWAPQSGPTSRFSDAVQWVFRVGSRPTPTAPDAAELVILCVFDVEQRITCWAGDEKVRGDASAPAGVTSASGRLRVFAGLRNDAYFFNTTGFKAASDRVRSAFQGTSRDKAGCPSVLPEEAVEIAASLRTGEMGSLAKDSFAGQSVLALVVEIDLALVKTGGPILAVSASTHKRP